MFEFKHTVFTPIYNRAHELHNVYESLLNSNYDKSLFEWLIIDDGSTDNLKEVVKEFFNAPFSVRCIHKENGGIHTAQNMAVKEAKGEYITRIDSDDAIHPDGLATMDKYIEYAQTNTEGVPFDKIIGVVGLCLNKTDGTVRGVGFSQEVIISTGREERNKGTKGDKNFCMKTEVMRKFLIPELPGTKWVPEGIIWNRIDREYKTVFVDLPFSICTEANEGSMLGSFMGNIANRGLGACMSAYYGELYAINESSDLLSLKQYCKSFVILWTNIISCKYKSFSTVMKELNGRHKIPGFLSFLPSFLYVWLKKRKLKGE